VGARRRLLRDPEVPVGPARARADHLLTEGRGGPRPAQREGTVHHTAPISAILGLHEGLRLVLEEGLEARWARHAEVGELFQSQLLDRDGTLLAQEGHRLPQLTSFAWPDGVDEGDLRGRLLTERGIEVGGGLGEFAGRAWRVGLMGEGATHANVDRLLDAVDELLEG
jgi:alanine-glyoxylate transaminase/serine-glyoxylate transaminase/serine-pyruvate transaminase